ncbi:HET-domain-containing protein [Xylaria sp. FL1042]|nr:HET-domain-containing protein [Xylaria sp. FL1042]
MLRCDYCARLSISLLIDLAKVEFSSRFVPQEAFYQHHTSLEDLESSAISGCDLCILIFDSLRGTPGHTPSDWVGHTLPVEDSMLATTQTLRATDIKIFIDAEHLFAGEPLENVRVFDVLRIHIGPVPEKCSRSIQEGAWHEDPLVLVLFRSPTGRPRVDGFEVGRLQSDPNLGSEANFDLARLWLSTCQNEHTECVKNYMPQLPTRVIDVGVKNCNQNLRLAIPRGERSPYVALSHCWGGQVSPLLLNDNIGDFKSVIRFQELPATFQDAITITRELNIRYLWIDSLCIIQNSKQDWGQESKKMGLYYGNSTLTIYASSAESSTSGIFQQRTPPAVGPRPVYINVFAEAEENQQIKVERMTDEGEDLNRLDKHSPLSSRGWTLQESVLASRHLYFGKRQIYWQCFRGFQSADGLPAGFRTPSRVYSSLIPALFSDTLANLGKVDVSTVNVLHDYYELTKEYSGRKLSHASDKLPAFSGLVQRIHSSISGDYLAGIWSCDFHSGLAWYRESKTCRHISSYRAPSWSWAVTDEPILFVGLEYRSDAFKLRLINYDLSLSDSTNPYGEINGGYVYVQGFVRSLYRSSKDISYERFAPKFGYANFDDLEGDSHKESRTISICPAIINNEDCLVTVQERLWEDEKLDSSFGDLMPDKYTALLIGTSEDTHDQLRVTALILRELLYSEGDDFERVGLLTFWIPKRNWLSKWEERTLKLF